MTLEENLDAFFLVINACIVFLMQCGFAFLECGEVRSKNATNILLKNMLDSFIGAIVYWLFGFAFAFGNGGVFIGDEYFALYDLPASLYAYFFFHFVFAATAATIVSGAVAERCELIAYFVYSIVITGFVYPIITHWAWHPDGWLAKGIEYSYEGNNNLRTIFLDFAGSGVVHLTGGTAALAAAAILGPRIGQFDSSGRVRDIRGHSVPLAALGGFILFFGFFAFNGGSVAGISADGSGEALGLIVVNTILSGSFGGLTCLCTRRIADYVGGQAPRWSLLNTINGGLCGMVAICAGCHIMHPWAAAVTGFVAGLVYLAVSTLLIKMRIDDPLHAVAVHAGGGLWGLVAAPLMAKDVGILYEWDKPSGMTFAWNILGAVAIIAWSGSISIAMFGALRLMKILRVSPEIELKGMDIAKHGEPAYPLGSYGDGWDDGWRGNEEENSYTDDGSESEVSPRPRPRRQHRRHPTSLPFTIPDAPMVMTNQGPRSMEGYRPTAGPVAVTPGYMPSRGNYFTAASKIPPYSVYNAYGK